MLQNIGEDILGFSAKKKAKWFLLTILGVGLFVQRYPLLSAAQDSNCAKVLDFVAVLDMSGSVGRSRWNDNVIPAARTFFEALEIAEEGVHTGLLFYDSTLAEKWNLGKIENYNKATALANLESVKGDYKGGGTNTARALTHALDNILLGPGKRKVPLLMLVITDGQSSDNVTSISARLKEEKVTVMVIGVANARESECKTIAGCPQTGTCDLFKKSDWNSLVSDIPAVMATVCKTLPKDAVCNGWGEWSACSVTCGKGITTRDRKTPFTLSPPVDGDNGVKGKTCEEQGLEEHQEKLCQKPECAVDAVCGSFGPWTCCSKTCGGGTMERSRLPWNQPPAQYGGKTCEDQGLQEKESQPCNTDPCPQDAVPGDWNEWSECSKTCGHGTRKRSRAPDKVPAANGGRTIAEQGFQAEEEEICQIVPCGPCAFQWAEWTKCTKTCGSGIRTRHRSVKFDYPSYICPLELHETDTCSEAACPTAAPTPTEKPSESGAGGGNTAAIAGGAIGGAALLAAAGGGAYYYTQPGGAGGAEAPGGQEQFTETGEQDVNPEEAEETVDVGPDSEFWQD